MANPIEEYLYEMLMGQGLQGQLNPQATGINNPDYRELAPLLRELAITRRKPDAEIPGFPLTSLLEPGAGSSQPSMAGAIGPGLSGAPPGQGLLSPRPDTSLAPAQSKQRPLQWWEVAMLTAGAPSPGLFSLLGNRQRMAPATVVGQRSNFGAVGDPNNLRYSLLQMRELTERIKAEAMQRDSILRRR